MVLRKEGNCGIRVCTAEGRILKNIEAWGPSGTSDVCGRLMCSEELLASLVTKLE